MNRKKSFMMNAGTSMLSKGVLLIIRFLLRAQFIKILGDEILGYNATFGNILSLLNLSELGIGYAITFKLYKPFAQKKYEEINNYLTIYRNFFRYIMVTMSMMGGVICFFLPLIVKTSYDKWGFLVGIFLLQLGKTVATYTFSYNKIILNVQEKNYLINFVELGTNLITLIVQFVSVVILKNYYLYLLVDIVGVLVSNIILHFYVRRKYRYIRIVKQKTQEFYAYIQEIKYSLKDVIIVKLGGYVLNATDYLVISMILGSVYSGFLSNYNLIFSNTQNLILVAMSSVQSIIGNALYKEKKEEVLKIVIKFTDILSIMATLFCPIAYVLIDDFITLWIGEQYVLTTWIGLLCSINVALMLLSNPISLLFGSLGYYHYDKKIIIFSALINIVVSVVLCKEIGVVGVLIGTTIAILVYWISRVVILNKKFFESMRQYYCAVIRVLIYLAGAYVIAGGIDGKMNCFSYWEFIIKAMFMGVAISGMLGVEFLMHKLIVRSNGRNKTA